MEYLIISGIVIVLAGLIFFIKNRFLSKTYPNKTVKLLDSVPDLNEIGLSRNENGFKGMYRNFPVSIFATTSMKSYEYYGGDQFQVWVATAPENEQLKKLSVLLGKYMVSGKKDGFAYVGFLVNAKATPNVKSTIINLTNQLISVLESNNIKPYSLN